MNNQKLINRIIELGKADNFFEKQVESDEFAQQILTNEARPVVKKAVDLIIKRGCVPNCAVNGDGTVDSDITTMNLTGLHDLLKYLRCLYKPHRLRRLRRG